MIDEFKKQLAAISGQDIGNIGFHSDREISEVDKRFNLAIDMGSKDRGTIEKELDKFGEAYSDFDRKKRTNTFIKDLHNDIGDGIDNDSDYGKGDSTRMRRSKANKAIDINFSEGEYPFYYKGKDSTLVGRIKGNQVIDVRTFHSSESLLTMQEFAKGRKGDAYRLEMNGKGIYNISQGAREGYDFLNFQEPTKQQLAANEKFGMLFATSSLEQMEAAFRDKSSIEALNYLGVELNAYSTVPQLEANGQIVFNPKMADKVGLDSNKPVSGNALIQSMNSTGGSPLSSNQSIGSSGRSTVKNLASNTLDSNGSLTDKVARLLKKVF